MPRITDKLSQRVASLHHIALTVKNTDESIKWYEDKLGFKLLLRYNKHGAEITHLQLGDIRIELFNFGEKTTPLPDDRKELMKDLHTIGTKHLCIEVENLDETVKELKEKEVEFVHDIDTAGFGGHWAFIKDCNGILIELYQR